MIGTDINNTASKAARPERLAPARRMWALGLFVAVLAGCSQSGKPVREEVTMPPQTMLAVAPALNFSGCRDFDPLQVADLMAGELAEVPGVGVIGVSRVMAVLADQGVDRIQSPEHALEVCESLGADAILVFAVTEYDAYTPVVGIAAQLYGRQAEGLQFDPVTTSRMARPFPVVTGEEKFRPWAQTQRRFHGEHDMTCRQVRDYAEDRNASDSPYGWKKYLASQQWFLRFCCHAVAGDLIRMTYPESEGVRTAVRVNRTRELG